MSTSQARIDANRRNALKSTGPRTPEGKEQSRRNGLKHGMAGEGVVTRLDDAAEVDRRSRAMLREMGPKTEMGRFLVNRLAELTVRVERCAKQEMAAVEARSLRAIDEYDESRLAEVDRLFAALEAEPATSARRLRAMPEGVDRMVATLIDLGDQLELGRWDSRHGGRLAGLMGASWADIQVPIARILTEAIAGDFRSLPPGELEGPSPEARMRSARQAMATLIGMEVDRLREHRETLDLDAIARERAGAPDRALFDPSKEATLARRYEAAAERGVFKALKELREVEAEAALVEVEPEVEPETEPLGSSRAGAVGHGSPPAPTAPAPRVPGSSTPGIELPRSPEHRMGSLGAA